MNKIWTVHNHNGGHVAGRVAINTDIGNEALTVHGNIQVSGQIMQPSDSRLKSIIREINPAEQLQNVNKLKIVQYKYRPEYINQLPEEEKHRELKF